MGRNKYPSSTQVMGLYSDFSGIPAGVLEYASARGSKVHKICSCIAQGQPYFGQVPPDHAGYILSFQQWLKMAVQEVVAVEIRLYDHDLGYCGQPDLIVRMKGDEFESVPDLKTPALVQRTWRGQMASYKNLAVKNGYDARRAFSVRLKKDGGLPKIDEYNHDSQDLAAFINALSAFKYFKS